MVDERPVAGAQPVVPHAGGHIGTHVGVELGLFHRTVGQVVVPPTAVVALHVGQPVVGPLGLDMEAGHIERHSGLDVVPRVAVTARPPRDHARWHLQPGDPLGALDDLVGAEHPGDIGHRHLGTPAQRFTP
jgi:hypothetical protein